MLSSACHAHTRGLSLLRRVKQITNIFRDGKEFQKFRMMNRVEHMYDGVLKGTDEAGNKYYEKAEPDIESVPSVNSGASSAQMIFTHWVTGFCSRVVQGVSCGRL